MTEALSRTVAPTRELGRSEPILRFSPDHGVMPPKYSSDSTVPRPPTRPWSGWRTEPGWLLMPLRAFLGVTFTYAGLQKLANPGYLDPNNPTSVAHQMLLLRRSSPIGFLLGLSAHAPTLVGLLIAFGELAVGLGTLIGLWTRVAAIGGALLSLTFFFSVSWNTTPYYYGSDIVFVFAWLVILGFGSAGVMSVDGWLRARARRELHLVQESATVAVDALRLRALCPRGPGCALAADGRCARQTGCPVFPVQEVLSARTDQDLARRTLLSGGAAAGIVGLFAVLLGGLTAVIGRLVGGTTRSSRFASAVRNSTPQSTKAATAPRLDKTTRPTSAASTPPPTSHTAGTPATSPNSAASTPPPTSNSTSPPATSPTSPASTATPSGTPITAASAVPVGQAVSFTNPADGNPGWLVHPSGGTFTAFSAACTHAGCPVQYDQSAAQFVCPCHGGVFDARTGQVLQGPPPSPLPQIAVHVVNGDIRTG
jgi:thiosulfate dehydrogenase [quinone] large subunit